MQAHDRSTLSDSTIAAPHGRSPRCLSARSPAVGPGPPSERRATCERGPAWNPAGVGQGLEREARLAHPRRAMLQKHGPARARIGDMLVPPCDARGLPGTSIEFEMGVDRIRAGERSQDVERAMIASMRTVMSRAIAGPIIREGDVGLGRDRCRRQVRSMLRRMSTATAMVMVSMGVGGQAWRKSPTAGTCPRRTGSATP